jgi:hypothetical protein
MAQLSVTFTFHSGVTCHLFRNRSALGQFGLRGTFFKSMDPNADGGTARWDWLRRF